jgi:pyrroloquinoline-quinone synthase
MSNHPYSRKSFASKLKAIGTSSYHHQHPFHVAMNEGLLGRPAIQIWVANRFYYQTNIPIKDAAIISNCHLREVLRLWLHRITDHDGVQKDEGGIGAWLRLGEACGLSRKALLSQDHVLPGVRFAVDAYVNFARTRAWPVAVASSLTELFAPDLMAKRLEAFKKFYPWVEAYGLEYFSKRLTQAPRDSGEALKLTLEHCKTIEMQEQALHALQFKCDLLWAVLDAINAHCQAASNLPRPGNPARRRV